MCFVNAFLSLTCLTLVDSPKNHRNDKGQYLLKGQMNKKCNKNPLKNSLTFNTF